MSENTGDAYGRTIRQLLSIYPVQPNLFSGNTGVFLIANYRPCNDQSAYLRRK